MRTVKLHNHHVLWPQHKSRAEVERLRATTPPFIFDVTYQGSMVSRGGVIFERNWWNGPTSRYDGSRAPVAVARYISLDTASSEAEEAAYTAWTVGDLLTDYKLAIVEMGRARMNMPDLVHHIEVLYNRFLANELLRGIVIEEKSSGIGALQTLRQASAIPVSMLIGFNPKVDKITRWSQSAVWCSLGCVLLPCPSPAYPWLFEAEEELFNVPNAPQLDQADSFAQLVIYLENFLSQGYNLRTGAYKESAYVPH